MERERRRPIEANSSQTSGRSTGAVACARDVRPNVRDHSRAPRDARHAHAHAAGPADHVPFHRQAPTRCRPSCTEGAVAASERFRNA